MLTCLAFTATSARALTAEDDLGRTLTLPAPATRIVSLAPHLTEILFALGVGDRVIATVRYADYPPAAKDIPRLGDAFSINVEAVMALQPDIVFAWKTGGSGRAVEKLAELGVPVYYNEAPRLADIGRSVISIGKLVGREAQGKALAQSFESRLKGVVKPSRPVVVFFQISDESIYSVNSDQLIGQAISLCGATNLFGDASSPVPLVNKEAVIAGKPDLIVVTQVPGSSPSPWIDRWSSWPGLAGKVETIDPNLISRPGLRMADGIEKLCGLVRKAADR
ncbi:MAG: cobalamin-binding protein [Pseudomonadales bacterium]|nr:cobalamin-binding protein [Pseudomonadales bacterium]